MTNGAAITTDYSSNYIYENGSLQFFHTPEGYVEPINASNYASLFRHTFQYKDHQGNIRLSYKDLNQNTGAISLSIVEENNYYPFGLKHKGYNGAVNGADYPYGFQDQEETNDPFGFNMIEFKYRMHDPAIGRFIQVDPLAKDYVYNGTYNFAENKVIQFNELEGLEAAIPVIYSDIIRTGEFFKGLISWGSGASKVVEDSTNGSKAAKVEMNNFLSNRTVYQNDFSKGPVNAEATSLMKEGSMQMTEALPDSEDVKAVGDGMSMAGSGMVMAAPYFGPLAPEVATFGGTIATTGTVISAGVDLYNGDGLSLSITLGSSALGVISKNQIIKQNIDQEGVKVLGEMTNTVMSNLGSATGTYIQEKKDDN